MIANTFKLCTHVLLFLFLSIFFRTSLAFPEHPLYLGLSGGYGSTTWQGLVPTEENQNAAMNMTTPIRVQEGGGVYGVFTGFDFSPFFALEGAYTKYPDATVHFAPLSLFSFEHEGTTEFTTRTETLSILAKIMLFLPNTQVRFYSGFGAASVHRDDILNNNWRLTPTFAVGFNYNFAPHILGEIGVSYTAGYGEAQLNPTDVYFPFLYAGFVRLGYRF